MVWEIPTQTVEAARTGDQAAQDFILKRIDVANAQPKAAPSPIAGTKIGPGGEIETDLPDDLTERETGAMEEYIDNRKDFFAFMNDKVVDSRVRDLLIDHYSTGEFFRETGRQLKETARFTGNIPNYLYALGMYVAPAAAEASVIDMFGGQILLSLKLGQNDSHRLHKPLPHIVRRWIRQEWMPHMNRA